MPAAQATISTSHAAVYLTRLSGHAAKMSTATKRLRHRPRAHAGGAPPEVQHVRHDGDEATVTLDCGQWIMHAAPGQLRIRAQAPGQDSLQRIQDLLTARLRKLGHREQLTITWQPALDQEEPDQPS
ncbi:MAG TPA: DUF2218 domain-containing protein [Trebonia sp.]|jgi:hypothetical protein|nr:DUF2218 domain-containing protein [Trebonia sp.]